MNGLGMLSGMTIYSMILLKKMLDKVTRGYMKMMELLHDMMEGRNYGQLKDLISGRSRWRQDRK